MTKDVFGVERFHTAATADQRRRLERRACDVQATAGTSHGDARVRILNISAGGIGFTIDPMLTLKPGDRMTLRHEKLGDIPCLIRWSLHPRYGAEFAFSGKVPAGVSAFYDSLPSGPEKTG
jgi:hypothetical protein